MTGRNSLIEIEMIEMRNGLEVDITILLLIKQAKLWDFIYVYYGFTFTTQLTKCINFLVATGFFYQFWLNMFSLNIYGHRGSFGGHVNAYIKLSLLTLLYLLSN